VRIAGVYIQPLSLISQQDGGGGEGWGEAGGPEREVGGTPYTEGSPPCAVLKKVEIGGSALGRLDESDRCAARGLEESNDASGVRVTSNKSAGGEEPHDSRSGL